MLKPVTDLHKTTCKLHGITQAQRAKIAQEIADAFPDEVEIVEDVVETYCSLDQQPVIQLRQISETKYLLQFYRV